MSKLADDQKELILRLLHRGRKGNGVVLTAEEDFEDEDEFELDYGRCKACRE
ncbi:hypothetical protein [Hymenobacter siberiensis]|uniref:hypothetical protein n=1 Tax=Hymenobacter siberiensis TaxID=2848396 RepID=UPI001C1E2EDF|nr:hypothetical protein [Hymenobacter siberiensis]